jgi:hypothetical protein
MSLQTEKIKRSIINFLWMNKKKFELSIKYYLKTNFSNQKYDKCCVVKFDGRVYSGGLADRLKSAVLIYAICKTKNVPFKIYFSVPFKLQDILSPNIYNWIITEKELTKSIFDTKILTSFIGKLELNYSNKKQIHSYNFGGGDINDINYQYHTNYSFSSLFQELFKPGEILSEQIDDMKKLIGGPYISVCFRFQSILGDFYEGEYYRKKGLTFDEKKKEELIESTVNSLLMISKRHPDNTILVTADSSIFLSKISKMPKIWTIPGEIVHMEYTRNNAISVYRKSFLDLYMLSGGEKIYRVSGKGLYESGFPMVAAFMADKEIEYINL